MDEMPRLQSSGHQEHCLLLPVRSYPSRGGNSEEVHQVSPDVYRICPFCKQSRKASRLKGGAGYFLQHNRQTGKDGNGAAIMKQCPGSATSAVSARKAS